MNTSFLKWLWTSSLVCSVFVIDGKADETDGKGLPSPPHWVGNNSGFSAQQSTLTLSPNSPSPYQAPMKNENSSSRPAQKRLPLLTSPFPPFQEPTKRKQTVTPEAPAPKERRIETAPPLETQPILRKIIPKGIIPQSGPFSLSPNSPFIPYLASMKRGLSLETQSEYDALFNLQRLLRSYWWDADDIYRGFKAIAWKHSNDGKRRKNRWKELPQEHQPQSYKNAKQKNKEVAIISWFDTCRGKGVEYQNKILSLLGKSGDFTLEEINTLKNQFKKKAPGIKLPSETTPLLETPPKYDALFKLQRLLESSWSLDDIYKGFKAIVWKHSNNKEGKENLWKKLPKKIQPQSYKEAKTIKSKERVISHWFGEQKSKRAENQNEIFELLEKSEGFTQKEINTLRRQFEKEISKRKRP